LTIPKFQAVNPEGELERLREARRLARNQLLALAEQVRQRTTEAEAALIEAQMMFLDDPALIDRAEAGIASGQNAEFAWYQAVEHFARQLDILPDETLRARAADIRDAGWRVLDVLLGTQSKPVFQEGCILIARDLTPSQTASLDPSRVLAFCTAEGGSTSHTAILARAYAIPAVVGLGEKILDVPDGTLLLVDGIRGMVTVDPDKETIATFQKQIREYQFKRSRQMREAQEPAITRDGHRVEVVANVGNLEEIQAALDYGAEGIGLLRTEFLFLNRDDAPKEDEQFAMYKAILESMQARPVVVRTLDIGGDKVLPYYNFGAEANPYLGYRAIRISLGHPDDFKTQLRALLRAGVNHDLRIMFPMIATIDELRQARALVEVARREIEERGQEAASRIQIGIMVEVPSTAILADRFAPEVDFFSIGTNDLTQYTLAAERGNKRVAYLYDGCHPAVLRLIQRVIQAGRDHARWVGVCGELAGDPEAIPILLGLGVNEFSVAPPLIPHTKALIRKWTFSEARQLASEALNLDSAKDVRALVQQMDATLFGR